MHRIHILDHMPAPGIPGKYWHPVFLNLSTFREMGLAFRFFSGIKPALTDCDTLFLSSRYFHLEGKAAGERKACLEQIAGLGSRVKAVVWFDIRDSSGNAQFEVLPYVTRYVKKQLLRDRSLYRKSLYGNRLFTDYYHRQFGVADAYEEAFCPLPGEQEHKLALAWNLGLTDFRSNTILSKAKDLLWDFIERFTRSGHRLEWGDPGEERANDLLALFNTKYERETVAFQRKKAFELLESAAMENSVYGGVRLPKKEYKRLMSDSKIVLSLFGWGEVCYRDMEAFMAGAALLMPDMSHLETWPDFYVPYRTYHPFKWDLSDMVDGCRKLLAKKKYRMELAAQGQRTYRSQWDRNGKERFCERMKQVILLGC